MKKERTANITFNQGSIHVPLDTFRFDKFSISVQSFAFELPCLKLRTVSVKSNSSRWKSGLNEITCDFITIAKSGIASSSYLSVLYGDFNDNCWEI